MVSSKHPGRVSPSLGASLPAISSAMMNTPVIHEGWVLKKRRKKMQGFARRYFTLYQSGLLAYAFEPHQPIRDQVSLHGAAISTASGRKDIHIDSNAATFHIKCLSTDDFNEWMVALRKFINPAAEARRSASVRLRQGSLRINQSGVYADEMGTSIVELEEAIQALKQDGLSKKPLHGSAKSRSDKEKSKDHASVFHLFRKSHATAGEFGHQSESSSDADHVLDPYQRVQTALSSLKAHHATLQKSLQTLAQLDPAQPRHGSPLPFTAEEEEQGGNGSQGSSRQPMSPSKRSSQRYSVETSIDSLNEWFDASEGHSAGAQEFFLDGDGTEQPSKILSNDSRSSLGQGDSDTDMESDEQAIEEKQPDPAHQSLQVTRRVKLPSGPIGDEGSLFAMLKKNVGKDLSTIAFPVTFNEPLTLLQRAAEELEYFDLLNQAAAANDSIERLRYVAAFAVSSYAHTRHRSGRKGFNPMLAETFEDARMKFIAEKVRHNPLEMAYHAEGNNWALHATSSGKTKFWGKSLEIIPLGATHLTIGNDHFIWKKPSSFMRNLMMGTKYLEHCGQMVIENSSDNSRCVLEFKQSGYWAAPNVVSGAVYDPSGQVVSELEGKWDEQISEKVDVSHFTVLWRASPWPKNMPDNYGFTAFGITLNEITDDIADKLPPTDSRYRPDVRALEEGDLDLAEEEKNRVEEMQRDRRRRGIEREPRWFKQVGEEWVYVGGYWEARAKGWKGTERVEALW